MARGLIETAMLGDFEWILDGLFPFGNCGSRFIQILFEHIWTYWGVVQEHTDAAMVQHAVQAAKQDVLGIQLLDLWYHQWWDMMRSKLVDDTWWHYVRICCPKDVGICWIESLPLLVFVLGTFGSDSFKIRPVDRRHQDRSKHPYGGVLLVADSHLESRLADMWWPWR